MTVYMKWREYEFFVLIVSNRLLFCVISIILNKDISVKLSFNTLLIYLSDIYFEQKKYAQTIVNIKRRDYI